MSNQPPSSNQSPQPNMLIRFFRAIWVGFCILGGGLIAGALAGFSTSNLWIGLAASIPGMVVGWYFGKNVSPIDFFFPPFGGD